MIGYSGYEAPYDVDVAFSEEERTYEFLEDGTCWVEVTTNYFDGLGRLSDTDVDGYFLNYIYPKERGLY